MYSTVYKQFWTRYRRLIMYRIFSPCTRVCMCLFLSVKGDKSFNIYLLTVIQSWQTYRRLDDVSSDGLIFFKKEKRDCCSLEYRLLRSKDKYHACADFFYFMFSHEKISFWQNCDFFRKRSPLFACKRTKNWVHSFVWLAVISNVQ